MFKMILLLRKRPDLSTGDFRAYYEQHHAPLGASCMPLASRYLRRYLAPAESSPGAAGFDVMTEVWFESRAVFDTAMAAIAHSDAAARLAADETQLFDASRTCYFVDDEAETRIQAQ